MATLADIFVVAGAADSVCQVFVAAEARWGIAITAAKAATVRRFWFRLFMVRLGVGWIFIVRSGKSLNSSDPDLGLDIPFGPGVGGLSS